MDVELVIMVQKYNVLFGKIKLLDCLEEVNLLKFQKGEVRMEQLEFMFGYIDISDYDRKMLMKYRVEELENKFYVKEIGIFMNGLEVIIVMVFIFVNNVWFYSDNFC